MSLQKLSLSLSVCTLLVGIVVGCAPTSDPSEETPATDACEHAAEGPFEDVTAAVGEQVPPDISAEHTAHNVATGDLMDAEGNRGGRVAFTSEEAGDYYIFLSEHMDVAVYDAADTVVELEESVHEVSECEEVTMYHLVELGIGTYELVLGPTSLEEITVVVVHGGEHAHEGE